MRRDLAVADKAMVSMPNKRQQARNERALQELIRTVPGNDRCADCQAGNPGPYWHSLYVYFDADDFL